MKNKSSVKNVFLLMGGMLTVALVIMAVLPLLSRLFKVEAQTAGRPEVTQNVVLEKAEPVSVTAVYQMEEGTKKISAIYIEVFHTGKGQVVYMEIPVDTRVNLSEELYKSLQTYAPELPQYLKLSNMAESFSVEYGLTGCNRILSEMFGISLENYIRADKENLQSWLALQAEEKSNTGFFEAYTLWLEESVSSKKTEERWGYYESWRAVKGIQMETAPGSREKDGFLLSCKRSKERLQELIAGVTQSETIEENKE